MIFYNQKIILYIYNEFKKKQHDINYYFIADALDELKTKLSNLEIMRKDSFMKIDRKK